MLYIRIHTDLIWLDKANAKELMLKKLHILSQNLLLFTLILYFISYYLILVLRYSHCLYY